MWAHVSSQNGAWHHYDPAVGLTLFLGILVGTVLVIVF